MAQDDVSVRRVAVVDIGSNSIKILVADVDLATGGVTTLFQRSEETRLGGGLGCDPPALTEEAMRAGVLSVQSLLAAATPFQPERTAITATSAVRDAINRDEFLNWLAAATGYRARVLTGDEEALWIADGVRCDPSIPPTTDIWILDQGGGSLEIIHSAGHGADIRAVSLPLGAVRLFKLFQHGDLGPLSSEVKSAIRHWVDKHWEAIPWLAESDGSATWVATGGALTLSRALLARQEGVEFEQRSPVLHRSDLESLFESMARHSVEDRMIHCGVPAARADILPAGLCALLAVMDRAGISRFHHSLCNLRYGAARRLAKGIFSPTQAV